MLLSHEHLVTVSLLREERIATTAASTNTMNATFLAPVPVTQENLSDVVGAGWITQEALCQGVSGGPAPCN